MVNYLFFLIFRQKKPTRIKTTNICQTPEWICIKTTSHQIPEIKNKPEKYFQIPFTQFQTRYLSEEIVYFHISLKSLKSSSSTHHYFCALEEQIQIRVLALLCYCRMTARMHSSTIQTLHKLIYRYIPILENLEHWTFPHCFNSEQPQKGAGQGSVQSFFQNSGSQLLLSPPSSPHLI